MPGDRRPVAVILEVSDLERSVSLCRDGFGLDLHPGDNAVEDRWIGGVHAEISWTQGSYLHFALYSAKVSQPLVHRSASPSKTSKLLTQRQWMVVPESSTSLGQNSGVEAHGMRTSTET